MLYQIDMASFLYQICNSYSMVPILFNNKVPEKLILSFEKGKLKMLVKVQLKM